MIPDIDQLVPEHGVYVEPFAGGASYFFHKKKVNAEYLNDINGNIAAFYRAMKNNFNELLSEIQSTIHCEYTFKEAKKIYFSSEPLSDVKRAWAVWVNSIMGFAGRLGDSFQWVRNKGDKWTAPTTTRNKKSNFEYYRDRLDYVTIFNRDALQVIKKLDAPNVFFYLDPPYAGAYQGHYSGYTQQDFEDLLIVLDQLEGNFLLSSYPNESLTSRNWNTKKIDMRLGVQNGSRKTEVLTWNYELKKRKFIQSNLF